MDKVIAARMTSELTGRKVGGWVLDRYIDCGKSALVFQASKEGVTSAIKIFDRELVDRYGKEAQRERVLREKSLVGKHHPNLIEILDAGEDVELDLFFVVMEFFSGENLAKCLSKIPMDHVPNLISQIAQAARFLEELGLAHRDIKPENIGISDDFTQAILLDLGVLRPVGLSHITDQHDQKAFIGTLQYSPPELLHREEADTTDGWRAVSFYQLGGVLHDLITKKPLFYEDLNPYAHLVEVVTHQKAEIYAPEAPSELRILAQDCLVKNPIQRLQLVSWDRFFEQPAVPGDLEAVKKRIAARRRGANMSNTILNATLITSNNYLIKKLQDKLDRILRDKSKINDLPPFIVDSPIPATGCIAITYSPSPAHALDMTLKVFVAGEIIDPRESILCLKFSSVIFVDSALIPPLPPDDRLAEFFHGVEADEVIESRLEELLLISFDRAQELSAQRHLTTGNEWTGIPGSN